MYRIFKKWYGRLRAHSNKRGTCNMEKEQEWVGNSHGNSPAQNLCLLFIITSEFIIWGKKVLVGIYHFLFSRGTSMPSPLSGSYPALIAIVYAWFSTESWSTWSECCYSAGLLKEIFKNWKRKQNYFIQYQKI